mmetsp:Transcript_64004/g.152644  ORF Transcript_64004/g.152644 Transcript_64004/m.152644 type:complete len:209 (+) Transcript_64004:125-751(+)
MVTASVVGKAAGRSPLLLAELSACAAAAAAARTPPASISSGFCVRPFRITPACSRLDSVATERRRRAIWTVRRFARIALRSVRSDRHAAEAPVTLVTPEHAPCTELRRGPNAERIFESAASSPSESAADRRDVSIACSTEVSSVLAATSAVSRRTVDEPQTSETVRCIPRRIASEASPGGSSVTTAWLSVVASCDLMDGMSGSTVAKL